MNIRQQDRSLISQHELFGRQHGFVLPGKQSAVLTQYCPSRHHQLCTLQRTKTAAHLLANNEVVARGVYVVVQLHKLRDGEVVLRREAGARRGRRGDVERALGRKRCRTISHTRAGDGVK